jgi:hypothetical protein
MKMIRGLKSLVQDAVEHGSRAVERVQLEMAKTPFDILETVEPLKAPVSGIRLIHDASVTYTHGMIRLVNRVAGDVLDKVIDAVDEGRVSQVGEEPGSPSREPRGPSA